MKAATFLCALLAIACGGGDESSGGPSGNGGSSSGGSAGSSTGGTAGSATGGSGGGAVNDFQFSNKSPSEYVRKDSLGVALTGLVLANRADGFNDGGPSDAGPYLVDFRNNLAKMHEAWRDQIDSLGFNPCSLSLFGVDAVTPCTAQAIYSGGPIVLDVILPDAIELHLDQPPGFPNGRILEDPITDLVTAMGFLDIGDDCPADPTGTCTLRTFVDTQMNPPANDVPFATEFPYLALPNGHDASEGYWPKSD